MHAVEAFEGLKWSTSLWNDLSRTYQIKISVSCTEASFTTKLFSAVLFPSLFISYTAEVADVASLWWKVLPSGTIYLTL